ncbi:MAG: multicopper oxidase domain-containing protein [Nocardioidaceae bacterium]
MSDRTPTRRGMWPARDLPVVVWLVAVPLVAAAHPWLPAPGWLMIHLLLLGAVSNAVVVWGRYFTDAVLHARPAPGDRAVQTRRLLLLNAGILGVVVGVPGGWWPLTLTGAALVVGAVGWHAGALAALLRRALPARFSGTVRYYVAACGCLVVGAGLGATLARGLDDRWDQRLVLAHAACNILGWLGLTVVGTLLTLWPTMLRTRIAEGAERAAGRALPVLLVAVLVVVGGAASGSRPVAAVGLLAYLVGLGLVAPAMVAAARTKPPSDFPTWSVAAAVVWLTACVGRLGVGLLVASSWTEVDRLVDAVVPFLAAGFGAQVLLGALSYLVPVALGGGPTPVRTATRVLDRGGALRVAVVNAGLLVTALPAPAPVRVLASAAVLIGLAAFLPLLVLGVGASLRARREPVSERAAGLPVPRPRGQLAGLVVTGVAVVVLAVAVGVSLDPAALARGGPGGPASAGVTPTGETTTVRVEAADMRFTPSRIQVPAGDRLVIELVNADDHDVHDLVLDSGADSGRLLPGERTSLDVGVVGRDLDGWCSVLGHRQLGMVLAVQVAGVGSTTSPAADGPATAMPGMDMDDNAGDAPSPRAPLDLGADPGPRFRARDAALPGLDPGRVHRRTLRVVEVDREVAPGRVAHLWTYDGQAPGPTLHGRVGDRFVIRLVNDATIGHSVDFHAGTLAPDGPMRTLAPGESLTYRFTATRAGIWMYHCSTMPMSAHIASGLFGAVVIEPPGLPPVDRSYVLVQSELYLGDGGEPVDMDELLAERPDAVVFNGYANQYDHRPLRARVGERVRVWVLDAGPDRPSAFHVVGGQFDTVWSEGAYLLRPGTGGAQVMPLQPAQGGFVELAFPEPGHYPFVSHVMVDAERGAHGVFEVLPAR